MISAMAMASHPFSNSPYPSPSRNSHTYPATSHLRSHHGMNGYSHPSRASSRLPPRPLPSTSVSVRGCGFASIDRTPSVTSITSLPPRQEPHLSPYRSSKTPPTSNGNIHYRRYVRNMTMGIPARPRSVYDTSGDQRSYSLTNSTDTSLYTPSLSPAISRFPSRPGPAVGRNYHRATSWSQIHPDRLMRAIEHCPQGNNLDLQLYTGLPNGLPPRESPQRHSIHGFTMYDQVNGKSRTYSMSSMRSMRSNESQDSSIGYSQQMYHSQNSVNSPHYQNRQHGGSHSRAHSDLYEDGYQDDVRPLKSSNRSSVRSRPLSSLLLLQRGQSMLLYGNMYQEVPYKQYQCQNRGERLKRASRRSSYSKLSSIQSEEDKWVEGEGFEVANESFRNSTYGWDLPRMRLSMFNLCPEGTVTQAASPEKDDQDERRKLNDTEFTTTLESTTRPYTPDKFITTHGRLKDLQPNKTVKSTSTGGTTTKSSRWKFGKRTPGSLKAEEIDLDLDLVPTLTTKEKPAKVQKGGKKLLKKIKPKTLRPSLDLDGTCEAVFVSKGKAVTSLEGFFWRKSNGWREQDGTADIDPQSEMDIVQPYRGSTTGLIKRVKGPLTNSKNVTIPPDAELEINVTPALLLGPADKLAAYVRGKFFTLRKWRIRIISVKPKDILINVTAGMVISRHKRIPSRTSTPFKGTQASVLTQTGSVKEAQSASPNASLANLKRRIAALSTKEGWRLWEGKLKSTAAWSESIDSDPAAITRTRSAHTVASSFNIKIVPERIGADSPSGFEVVAGKGAGRVWGVGAPEPLEISGIGEAITTGSLEIIPNSECQIPGKHSLDACKVGSGHEQERVKEGMWKWLGGKTTPRKSKPEPLVNNRFRTSISAGE
ncbi:hypothetical protein EV426DRAFT_641991 [Tirmania nivea]|nr:hypothetical protein EV426DRAFT_641991 [Tirmania nivea]